MRLGEILQRGRSCERSLKGGGALTRFFYATLACTIFHESALRLVFAFYSINASF